MFYRPNYGLCSIKTSTDCSIDCVPHNSRNNSTNYSTDSVDNYTECSNELQTAACSIGTSTECVTDHPIYGVL